MLVRSGSCSLRLPSSASARTFNSACTRSTMATPWVPASIEQRDGRMLRQGNSYPEVHICQYVTEGSFDAYSWQLLENKSRFISQVMRGEVTGRVAEDVDLAVLTASQIKAIASTGLRDRAATERGER